MEKAHRIAMGRKSQPEEGNLEDAVGTGLGGGGDPGSCDVGGGPLEEDEGRGAGSALADAAPEADEVLPAVESAVKEGVGDAARSGSARCPGANQGLGAPAAVAHGEPDGAVGCGGAA